MFEGCRTSRLKKECQLQQISFDQLRVGWGGGLPAEHDSCFSINSNSFLSYLALIHCSLSSLETNKNTTVSFLTAQRATHKLLFSSNQQFFDIFTINNLNAQHSFEDCISASALHAQVLIENCLWTRKIMNLSYFGQTL